MKEKNLDYYCIGCEREWRSDRKMDSVFIWNGEIDDDVTADYIGLCKECKRKLTKS